MGINLVTFYGSTVTPQDDALIHESALAGSGLIYGGTVTIKSANMLHVAAGHGALCGRKFTIEETDVPVILSSSGTLLGRIYIHMDLSDTGEPISFQVETGSALAPVIQQQDVNIIDGVYEINLATFDVDTASISNLVNVAPYIEADLDTEFSTTSKKALQNKVITKALGDPETIGGAASKAYSKGSLLLGKDGQLYEVTTAISQGDTIINNGNVKTTGNVITQISNFTKIEKYSTASDIFASANVTFSNISLVKNGNIIDLAFLTNAFSISAGNWTTIGTLKTQFYPIATHNLCFVSNGDGRSFQAKVDYQGKVQIWSSSALNHSVGGCLTYLHEN